MNEMYVTANINSSSSIVVRRTGANKVGVYVMDCGLQISISPEVAQNLARQMLETVWGMEGEEEMKTCHSKCRS